MTAIAWAIFCAAFVLQHRDRSEINFTFNNYVDSFFFFMGLTFLIYFSVTK